MPLPPLASTPRGVDPAQFEAAAESVRAYCRWHVAPVIEETLVLDGGGARRLILPTLRVVEILSLEVDGHEVDDPEWSAAGILFGRFPDRPRSVKVTMRHGFDECPLGVGEVVASVARAAEIGRMPTTIQVDDARVGYGAAPTPVADTGWASGQRRQLDPYRLPVLA